MTIFKSNYTKWIPLGNYSYNNKDYLVFCRKNIKNGLIYFKTQSVHGWRISANRLLTNDLINTKEQWDKIINL